MTRARWIVLIAALLANAMVLAALLARFSYAPLPSLRRVANPGSYPLEGAYDVLGRTLSAKEAGALAASEEGRRQLGAALGAVPLTERLARDGREVFYRETFGNEYFLTDVLGILDGGISAWGVARALLGVAGRGTHDLQVRLSEDVKLGERVLRKGTVVSTGLDVPRGGWLPLGVRVFYDRGHLRVGVTCAACHSTVEVDSGLVVEGAPNVDLNAGLLLALASNSAAYYLHTGVMSLEPYSSESSETVRGSEGRYVRLPDADLFEAAVSGMLAAWPPGSFDSTVDGVSDPVSIPDCFTRGEHPYGWTGFAAIGPFRGLSLLPSSHALVQDELAWADALPALLERDPEVHLAVVLRRASSSKLRFDPYGAAAPSELLRQATPTPESPGLGRFAALPSYPRPNYVTTQSLTPVRAGEPIGYGLDALSAFQNSLSSPPRYALNALGIEQGQGVFESAGCKECHAGPAFTNHRVIPIEQIATEPTRARALQSTRSSVVPPFLFAPDTPYPPPAEVKPIPIPLTPETTDLLRLAWAHDGRGGYKVMGLIGLEWTAPYLHDGGVAVGPDALAEVGVTGTVGRGVAPDPRNSLLALIDRPLRARVVKSNQASPALVASHVTGQGHRYWVDRMSGYSVSDQQALIDYLLSLRTIAVR